MIVVSGSAGRRVGERIAREIHCDHVPVETREFPDGEIYVRVPPVKGLDVVYVQSTWPTSRVVEALLTLDALRRNKASTLRVIFPYFGYARQDRAFLEGEAESARAWAETLGRFADEVVVVDPHKESLLSFFPVLARSVTAVPVLGEYLRSLNPTLVVAPDRGASAKARALAEILGVESLEIEKRRLSSLEVEVVPPSRSLISERVVVVDDVISTGGTIARVGEVLHRAGASKVVAACTHGLFVSQAAEKILKSGIDEIISTDTVENPFSVVSVAPLLAHLLS